MTSGEGHAVPVDVVVVDQPASQGMTGMGSKMIVPGTTRRSRWSMDGRNWKRGRVDRVIFSSLARDGYGWDVSCVTMIGAQSEPGRHDQASEDA